MIQWYTSVWKCSIFNSKTLQTPKKQGQARITSLRHFPTGEWKYKYTSTHMHKQTHKPNTRVHQLHDDWGASVRIKRGGNRRVRQREWERQGESQRARDVTPALTDWIRNRSSLPRVIDMQWWHAVCGVECREAQLCVVILCECSCVCVKCGLLLSYVSCWYHLLSSLARHHQHFKNKNLKVHDLQSTIQTNKHKQIKNCL